MVRLPRRVSGQLLLPFGRPKSRPPKEERIMLSKREKKAAIGRAYALAMRAYAAMCRSPGLFSDRGIAADKSLIGKFIGDFRRNKVTYAKAQAAAGHAASVLQKMGEKPAN